MRSDSSAVICARLLSATLVSAVELGLGSVICASAPAALLPKASSFGLGFVEELQVLPWRRRSALLAELQGLRGALHVAAGGDGLVENLRCAV